MHCTKRERAQYILKKHVGANLVCIVHYWHVVAMHGVHSAMHAHYALHLDDPPKVPTRPASSL